jgi:hypothetical protein
MSLPGTTGATRSRARFTLLALAAIAIAPVALSYAFYYLMPRESRFNYGELLPTAPMVPVEGALADGTAFRLADLKGRWVMLMVASGPCDAACGRMLYASRQAKTMQNADEGRVVRALLAAGATPLPADIAAEHPGLVIAHVAPAAVAALPRGDRAIYLVDPLGNQVLAWPVDPDIRALSKDLGRVLKASRIG